jgi:hypothetical protein
MKDWYASHPHLFIKRPYDHPGCDNSRGHEAGFAKGAMLGALATIGTLTAAGLAILYSKK